MAMNFKVLTTLSLKPTRPSDKLTGHCFYALFAKISTLRELDLSNNLLVGDTSFKPAHDHLPAACPNMEILVLEGCPNVGNASLSLVGKMCPGLRVLVASDTVHINHTVDLVRSGKILQNEVHRFADFSVFKNLEVADFSASYFIDDDFVRDLCSNNPKLRKLYLGQGAPDNKEEILDENRHHLHITSRAFLHVCSLCPQMRELKLENSDVFGNFHAEGLSYPDAAALPNLTSLMLGHSKSLNTQSLIHISHTAPNMQYLDVNYCPLIQHSRWSSVCRAMEITYLWWEALLPSVDFPRSIIPTPCVKPFATVVLSRSNDRALPTQFALLS
jgi:hypothetical protein